MAVAETVEGGGGKYTLEPGEYHFRVVEQMETANGHVFRTEDDTSMDNDPQIKLVLKAGDDNGTIHVLESLTFSEKALWRISAFLKSVGAYPGKGELFSLDAEKCIGMTGRCSTINKMPTNGKYERTKIKDWIPAQAQKPELIAKVKPTETELAMESQRKQEPKQDYSDSIPF
jgi:hypothetical protein